VLLKALCLVFEVRSICYSSSHQPSFRESKTLNQARSVLLDCQSQSNGDTSKSANSLGLDETNQAKVFSSPHPTESKVRVYLNSDERRPLSFHTSFQSYQMQRSFSTPCSSIAQYIFRGKSLSYLHIAVYWGMKVEVSSSVVFKEAVKLVYERRSYRRGFNKDGSWKTVTETQNFLGEDAEPAICLEWEDPLHDQPSVTSKQNGNLRSFKRSQLLWWPFLQYGG
jgi:hypothetical protein